MTTDSNPKQGSKFASRWVAAANVSKQFREILKSNALAKQKAAARSSRSSSASTKTDGDSSPTAFTTKAYRAQKEERQRAFDEISKSDHRVKDELAKLKADVRLGSQHINRAKR